MVEYFNPSQQQYIGVFDNDSRPTVQMGQSGTTSTLAGKTVGYVRAVLKFECGYTGLIVAANPGPWSYTSTVRDGVKSVQALFGLPQTGIADLATLQCLDVCVAF
jgi:murein L,D-transpeptidase YcbB/YkuD